LDGELRDVQEALEVRRNERPEVLGCVVRERLGEEYAGVVDQYVYGLETRQRCLDDPGGSRRLADVAVHQSDLVRGRDLSGLGHLPGVGDDVEPAFDKRLRDSGADTLRCSGHDSCLLLAVHGYYLEKLVMLRRSNVVVIARRHAAAAR